MNKQIEALKMAVREMTDAIPHLDIHFDDYFEALNACKEALAEAEKQEIGEAEIRQMLKEIEWCHQELEKIEKQEPVAIVMEDSYGYGASLYKRLPLGTKLYTHHTTWQSLSDDEIEDIWNRNWDVGYKACARAIEQALKEKNGMG